MRRTVYLSLAALGAASIATAAVMTTGPTGLNANAEQQLRAATGTTQTHHIRSSVNESETSESKRECRHHCPLFGW
ncbi:MAG: hypothetical protein H7X80_09120 [bacterium]|nr:hypothetical protein [Candidatus Kapabacteria bacterium]